MTQIQNMTVPFKSMLSFYLVSVIGISNLDIVYFLSFDALYFLNKRFQIGKQEAMDFFVILVHMTLSDMSDTK